MTLSDSIPSRHPLGLAISRRRKVIAIISVLLVALISYALHQVDRRRLTSLSTVPPNFASLPTATWLSDTGATFQFRADGSGRSRDPQSAALPIQYFEWDIDGTVLTIHYVPQGRLENILAYQTGHDTAAMNLTTVTKDKIVATLDGVQIQFSTTTDALLDSAP